jgi:hypothetical protein
MSCAAIGFRIYDAYVRIAGIVIGIVVTLMGAVWMLQGVNSQIVPQSFMTGSRVWIVIGAFAVVGGLALTRWNWTRR